MEINIIKNPKISKVCEGLKKNSNTNICSYENTSICDTCCYNWKRLKKRGLLNG